MEEPTADELADSIQDLMNYRDRLRNEFISISQKLRIPNKKINSSIESHSELQNINKFLATLIKQKNNQLNTKS